MKEYSGIVMEINKNIASIMTEDGQFINVKIKNQALSVGEIYTGTESFKIDFSIFRTSKILVACIIFLVVLTGSSSYAYLKPVTTMIVNINPSIQLKANKWNRVISIKNLNRDGAKILHEINIRNKSLDTALELIVNQAVQDNIVDDKYIEKGKTISIFISTKNVADDKEPLLKKSIDTIENIGVKATINTNGKKVKYIKGTKKKQSTTTNTTTTSDNGNNNANNNDNAKSNSNNKNNNLKKNTTTNASEKNDRNNKKNKNINSNSNTKAKVKD